MNKFFKLNSLINQTYFLVFISILVGATTSFIWVTSNNQWNIFLNNAYNSGISIYNTIKYNNDLNANITIKKLDNNNDLISRKELEQYYIKASPFKVTTLSISNDKKSNIDQGKISLHIISSKLKYPLAKIESFEILTREQQLGKVIQLVANYCSTTILLIKIDESFWHRIDGNEVWSCQAAPNDKRLIALIIFIISVIFMCFLIRENDLKFNNFILNLRNNLNSQRNTLNDLKGPSELTQIKNTLDQFLKVQKVKLEKRLMVLSSISHDIGTPATKLKLRTSLIEDNKLREKLETDIDQMIDMMNGVLSYTRSEMDLEEETEISYISLIESIVFDYQDLGKNVSFIKPKEKNIGLVSSIFSSHQNRKSVQLNQSHPLLVNAKPMSLQRAINNLIENALKYGRTATLSLETNSQTITLIIEDESKNITEELLENLKQPFIRGKNVGFTKGTGLGLTIVSTIAEQHGGNLTFEKSKTGIKAKLMIKR